MKKLILALITLYIPFSFANEQCEEGLELVAEQADAAPHRSLLTKVRKPETVLIDRILATAIRLGASDVHINVGRKPLLRLHGKLVALDTKVITAADTVAVMKAITPETNRHELFEERGTDFSFTIMDTRFRVSVGYTQGDLNVVLRLISNDIMNMDQIGLPQVVQDVVGVSRGIYLVTGPTGSGKTTTLAAMLQHINLTQPVHIVTLEDPIEYIFPDAMAAVTQREVGEKADVPSFYEGVRRGLRMDPDVILVGEMRDQETIRIALRAAQTGHLVLSTLHSNDAASAFERIIEEFPESEQDQVRYRLARTVVGVLNQRLLRNADGRGRRAAFEVLTMTDAIRNHVRDGDFFRIPDEMQRGASHGMQLLDNEIFLMIQAGEVEREYALKQAANRRMLEQRLGIND